MFAARWLVPFPLSTILVALLGNAHVWSTEPVVPGTGLKLTRVGDDFEDPAWEYLYRGPKSSQEMDEQARLPVGEARNGRWYEGIKRGHPDVVRRVPTPPGGLEGSTGALLLQSQRTGIPGRITNRLQQDDFVADVNYRLGGLIPAAQCPSVVVRVFLPPLDQWEKRTGPHFAFRCACETYRDGDVETYWPGMFIVAEHDDNQSHYAYIRIRANGRGQDYRSRQITQTGWWTLGLSVTPDGRVHYYARPGTDDLAADDYLASEHAYGYRCQRFKTFFFNVCNIDDGKTWSTPWIIDDPSVYYTPTETARRPPPSY
jgi:hypothetical protein